MKSEEIRRVFLDFFEKRGHKIIQSSPLIPQDPTLLFTSAGMVQFKPYWSREEPPPFSKAVSIQKCLRAGGKDSDIENVGKTVRHHTFFEMLGNFSFGDYFKEGAIELAWEFVNKELGLDKEKIWVSVYLEDGESFSIWKKILPEKRVIKLGKRDNFWGPVGESGVCGPSSEIYYDLGKDVGCRKSDCLPGCECGRFLEFWNLVFPQFNKVRDGKFIPLSRPGVDTGMGLERTAAILQGVKSNYETDLFLPIIKRIEKLTKRRYEEDKSSFQIIADHIRALSFSLAENIIPSNEGRGYVLRRMIRRATLAAKRLGKEEPFLYQVVPAVSSSMLSAYPYIKEKEKEISSIIEEEEENYIELLHRGKDLFSQFLPSDTNFASGELLFKIYDTYGLPYSLLQELGKEMNISLDEEGFKKELKRAREESRKKSKFESPGEDLSGIPSTIFVGYERLTSEARVLALFPKEKTCHLILDKTPFYPEKGGQMGDRGIIKVTSHQSPVTRNEEIITSHQSPVTSSGRACSAEEVRVVDTQIDEKGFIHHILEPTTSLSIKEGDTVLSMVDADFRKDVSANHTGTHLLHYALRKVLGEDVRQAGSLVTNNYLRFDFTYFKPISSETVQRIEEIINEKVLSSDRIMVEEMSLKEAKEKGAIALFTEKYGERLRVVKIGDYSLEACGGTHLSSTAEIGFFKIKSFSSIGKGLKRIEGLTRKESLKMINQRERSLFQISSLLKVSPEKVLSAVKESGEKVKKEKERGDLLERELLPLISESLIKESEGKKIFAKEVMVSSPESLRRLSDNLTEKLGGIILLGTVKERKVYLILRVSPEMGKKGFSAVRLIERIIPLIKGGGGGREDFAQAQGKNPEGLKEVISNFDKIIGEER